MQHCLQINYNKKNSYFSTVQTNFEANVELRQPVFTNLSVTTSQSSFSINFSYLLFYRSITFFYRISQINVKNALLGIWYLVSLFCTSLLFTCRYNNDITIHCIIQSSSRSSMLVFLLEQVCLDHSHIPTCHCSAYSKDQTEEKQRLVCWRRRLWSCRRGGGGVEAICIFVNAEILNEAKV